MNKELLKEEKSTRLYTGSWLLLEKKQKTKYQKLSRKEKKKSLILGSSSSVSVICEPLALRESKKREKIA
jgi:hypothetical protein